MRPQATHHQLGFYMCDVSDVRVLGGVGNDFSKKTFYCVSTSYPMDKCYSGRRRRPVFPPAGRSLVLVHSPDGVSYSLPV